MDQFALVLFISAILAFALAWVMLRTGFPKATAYEGRYRALAFFTAAALGTALVLAAAAILDDGMFHYHGKQSSVLLRPEDPFFWFFLGLFWVPGVGTWGLALANLFRRSSTRVPRRNHRLP